MKNYTLHFATLTTLADFEEISQVQASWGGMQLTFLSHWHGKSKNREYEANFYYSR